jgi:hypothetical protein
MPLHCVCLYGVTYRQAHTVGAGHHTHLETTLLYNTSIKKAHEWNYNKLHSLNIF